MILIIHSENDALSISFWNEGKLCCFLWSDIDRERDLSRALQLLGNRFRWIVWVGKPLFETMQSLVSISWPSSWKEFRNFLMHNPLVAQKRLSNRLEGEWLFYPREWVGGKEPFLAHQQIVVELESIVGKFSMPNQSESFYYPIPSKEAVQSWCAQMNIAVGSKSSQKVGKTLVWTSEGRWIQSSPGEGKMELSRKESGSLWECRDLWRWLQQENIVEVQISDLFLSIPSPATYA